MEAFVNNELKRVWVASAEVETVQGDLDRAEMALREAIVEAMIAGEPMDGICAAANLTPAELTRRVRAQGIPARPEEPTESMEDGNAALRV